MLESKIRALQEILIARADRFLYGETLSPAVRSAFLKTPRHCFAPRFPDGRPGLWSEVDEALLEAQLDTLYADQPYCIYRDSHDQVVSTISQPSLVLYMLHLLELAPNARVFELGGGSGWNAAMMGHIVGPGGQVTSVESIAALEANAQLAIARTGLSNVHWICGDANECIRDLEPFDRGVFTASSWSLPALFFEKIKEGGVLLFVFEIDDTCDLLAVLRKRSEAFISELHFPCRFVPVTGTAGAPSGHSDEKGVNALRQELSQKALDWADLDLRIETSSSASPQRGEHRFERGDSTFIWTERSD